MFVKRIVFLSVGAPFLQSYIHSDFLGKLIFLSLIITSILSWTLMLYKIWLTWLTRRNSREFQAILQKQKGNLLNIESERVGGNRHNPFFDLFLVLKRKTLDLLNKNRHFALQSGGAVYLSPTDIEYLESHLYSAIADHTKELEKYLFILSTIVGLGPLLGLLGTVWGILNTFSEMQSHALSTSNQMVLGGIALALTTTVLGLLAAIPALIGYNYLKNSVRYFETEMDGFSNEILSSIEMQYRKVDVTH